MNRLQAIVIEESDEMRHTVEQYLQELPEVVCLLASANPLSALPVLAAQPVHVLFCGVAFSRLTGFEFVQSLRQPPPVVFLSASPTCAYEAIRANAADYLLAPFALPEMLHALGRVRERLRFAGLMAPSGPSFLQEVCWVRSEGNLVRIAYAEILYVEAVDSFIRIHTVRGTHAAWLTLKRFEQQISPATIVRIHKSYLVNLQHLEKVTLEEVVVTGKSLPVSRTFRDELVARLDPALLRK